VTSEIIAVGSELLTPQRVDTNSLFLTRKLNECGIEVVRKSIIGDDREKLTNAICNARKSSDLVITTGGLGPTLDDITRDAVAKAVDCELVYHDQITQGIRERFLRRGHKMAEVNRRQAYIVKGADILENPKGTAPGQWFKDALGILILLPGPPRELEPMVEHECVPRLKKIGSPHKYHTVIMRSAGVPESELDERIGPIYSTASSVATTILAAPGDIQIHLRACGDTIEQAQVLAEALAEKIENELGDAIYNRGSEEIEEVVGTHLQRLGLTLAVAESCTGGLLAQRLTAIQGSSKYFLGGWVSYTESSKTNFLGVPESTIVKYGSVSKEAAKAMALQAKNKSGASFSVSITGFAGPARDTDTAPVGTVYIGVADPSGCVEVSHHCFSGDRSFVRMLAVQTALRLLFSTIRNQ
jgi:nicotinamide-nucleotide amidase